MYVCTNRKNIFILIAWANFILRLCTRQISNIVTENAFRRHEYQ